VVFTQEIEHLLGLGGFGKRGVAAKIAEHDDDLAAMAFEDLFIPLRDDQFGKLRCEKPFQSSDSTQFVNLLGYARLQASVQFRHLVGTLPQLGKKPRIFHRDDRLRCEVLQQGDLLVGERPHLLAVNMDNTQ